MTANGPAVRPRLGALARLWVAQRRRSTLGWTLGVVAMTVLVLREIARPWAGEAAC